MVAARDGSGEHSTPVFGMAAVDFSPVDAKLATIGATEPVAAPAEIPIGPLRLIDAVSGETRTLLDGIVVSFAWSPDGSTIAAIRIVPVAAGSNVRSSSPSASPVSPAASSAPAGRNEIRLTFVDVATGRVRSEAAVSPGAQFVNGLLTYFDQYALSHRLWAPDSSSILLPQVDAPGRRTSTCSSLTVVPRYHSRARSGSGVPDATRLVGQRRSGPALVRARNQGALRDDGAADAGRDR